MDDLDISPRNTKRKSNSGFRKGELVYQKISLLCNLCTNKGDANVEPLRPTWIFSWYLEFLAQTWTAHCNTFLTNTRKGGKEICLLDQIDTQPLRSEKNHNIRKYWSPWSERPYFNIIARSQGSFWVTRTEWHTAVAIKSQGCVATLNVLKACGSFGEPYWSQPTFTS